MHRRPTRPKIRVGRPTRFRRLWMFNRIPKILRVTRRRPRLLGANFAYFYTSLPRSSSVTNLKCLSTVY